MQVGRFVDVLIDRAMRELPAPILWSVTIQNPTLLPTPVAVVTFTVSVPHRGRAVWDVTTELLGDIGEARWPLLVEDALRGLRVKVGL